MHGLLLLTLASYLAGTQANPVNPLFRVTADGQDAFVLPPARSQRRLQGCPGTPAGFTFHQGMDIPGNNINCRPLTTSWTVASLAQNCSADKACLAFSIRSGKEGCLISAQGPLKDSSRTTMQDPCSGTYVQDCAPAPPGYTFHKSVALHEDVTCHWLGTLTVDDLAQMCDASATCQSFNIYTGGLTDPDAYCFSTGVGGLVDLAPNNMAPGKCYGSYVPGCPKAPEGYTFYPALDILKNDITWRTRGNLTVMQLAIKCSSTKGCLSFNVFKGPKDTAEKYCLKSSRDNRVNATNTTMAGNCQGSYIADCPAAEGYKFYPGMDVPGKSITCKPFANLTIHDVAQKCSSYKNCMSFDVFSNKGTTNSYCLKWATTGLVNARTKNMKSYCHGSYVEDCPAVPLNYKFHSGVDVAGSNTSCQPLGTTSLKTVALQCSLDSTCLSFSTRKNQQGGIDYCFHATAGPLVSRTSTYMSGRCFGSYVEECPAAPKNYTFYKSKTLTGEPLGCWLTGNLTFQDIVAACAKSSTCRSINTYKGSGGDAYCLWDRAGPLSDLGKDNLDDNRCYGSYVAGPPPASSSWLSYWGGPIMVKTVNVHMIYVGGYKPSDPIPSTLNHLVANLGDSDWWRLNTRYYMDPPNVPKRTYANGRIKLAGTYYVNSTADMKLNNNHTARDVAQSIRTVINRGLVPWDPEQAIYMIVSKPGEYTLRDCQPNPYCGWHTSWSLYESASDWSNMKFAFIPEVACGVCSVTSGNVGIDGYSASTSPTGSGQLDALVSTVSHELSETVTDPQIDAWTTLYGDENADICAWDFGAPALYQESMGRQVYANALVGQKPYLIQLNYDPSIKPGTNGKEQWGCVYGVDSSGRTISLDQGPPLRIAQ